MTLPRRPAATLSLLAVLLSVAALAGCASEPTLRDFVAESQGRQAYGIYFGKQKFGWMIFDSHLATRDGREVAEVVTEGRISMSIFGKTVESDERQEIRYALEGEGPVIYAHERKTEDGVETVRTAVPEGVGLKVESKVGRSAPTIRTIKRPKDSLAGSRAIDRWLRSVPPKGDTRDDWSLDLESDDPDKKETFTFLEKKTEPLNGVPTDVFRVRVLTQGLKGEADVTSDGRIVRGKIGPLDLRPEEESVAKRLDGAAAADVLAEIPVDADLGAPGDLDELVLDIEGLGGHLLPAPQRQRAEVRPGGIVRLEIRRDGRANDAAPLSKEDREKFLKATPTIQSDDEGVRALAARVAGREKDPIAASRKLCRWVFLNLKKRYGANASTASQVLERRAGDCTEHALLFTALARAAGIPARQLGGLMYARQTKSAFAWHAWAEIHDGRQWVSVDPTWNQVYVDAGHLQMSDDEEDLAWANVLGSLKVKVVRSKAKSP